MPAKTAEARSEAARKAWRTRRESKLFAALAVACVPGPVVGVPGTIDGEPILASDEKSAAQRNAEARSRDWGKLAAWIDASEHRRMLLESVARANKELKFPSQQQAMGLAWRAYWAASHKSNGSQAIRDLIDADLLVNCSPLSPRAWLVVNWEFVGILSDWQEESGLPRLDVRLKDQRKHRNYRGRNDVWG